MALEILEKHAVVQGIPLVKVSDRHFWFSWPQLVLYLIHFTLFQVLAYLFLANIGLVFLNLSDLLFLYTFPECI